MRHLKTTNQFISALKHPSNRNKYTTPFPLQARRARLQCEYSNLRVFAPTYTRDY